MIIDITGVVLTPGNFGNECMGNGNHYDLNGFPIACCCDECDYSFVARISSGKYNVKSAWILIAPRHKGTQAR